MNFNLSLLSYAGTAAGTIPGTFHRLGRLTVARLNHPINQSSFCQAQSFHNPNALMVILRF